MKMNEWNVDEEECKRATTSQLLQNGRLHYRDYPNSIPATYFLAQSEKPYTYIYEMIL